MVFGCFSNEIYFLYSHMTKDEPYDWLMISFSNNLFSSFTFLFGFTFQKKSIAPCNFLLGETDFTFNCASWPKFLINESAMSQRDLQLV